MIFNRFNYGNERMNEKKKYEKKQQQQQQTEYLNAQMVYTVGNCAGTITFHVIR